MTNHTRVVGWGLIPWPGEKKRRRNAERLARMTPQARYEEAEFLKTLTFRNLLRDEKGFKDKSKFVAEEILWGVWGKRWYSRPRRTYYNWRKVRWTEHVKPGDLVHTCSGYRIVASVDYNLEMTDVHGGQHDLLHCCSDWRQS